MRDALTWVAVYKDGSQLEEFDESGDHGFAEVDASNVAALCLVGDGFRLCVAIAEGKTPVFFRRRSIILDLEGNETGRSSRTCIGYDGAYLWIYEDGTLLLTADKV